MCRIAPLAFALALILALPAAADAPLANYRVEKVDGLHFEVMSFARKGDSFDFVDAKGRKISRAASAIARIVPLDGQDAIVVSATEAPAAVAAVPKHAPPLSPEEAGRALANDPDAPNFRVWRSGSEFFAINYYDEAPWRIFLHPGGSKSRHLITSIEAIVRLTPAQAKEAGDKFAESASENASASRVAARTEARRQARRAARWRAYYDANATGQALASMTTEAIASSNASPNVGGYSGSGGWNSGRTQYVRGYFRQDGTYVHSYYRRPPR